MRATALLLVLLSGAAPATAGTVVSDSVSDVSITIYRDPGRREGAMNHAWPGGYALVSETRTLRIPAGESVIRFVGVADGMLPETAIVSGLPSGVREKNRDARLISPAGLVDANLKRRVTLQRTDRRTGELREQEAIIQAGPNGGVLLQTDEGIEALGCSGLPERMLYAGVPDDLSARPTLSVLTTSDRATEVTVQLSYLAQGFDWSANYVAAMAESGATLGLFAWLTVANGGSQGFADASLQVVAGQPNRERARRGAPAGPPPALRLQCWPMDVTSTHPRWSLAPPPPPAPPPPMAMDMAESIVVTAQRRSAPLASPTPVVAISAEQEELGDLKLYRVPIRVTVAAKGQKQVAMLNQPAAKFVCRYVANVSAGEDTPQAMTLVLRAKNDKASGLGLPLPAGGVAVFEPVAGRSLLAGEDRLADRAIGEEVEIALGDSPDVQWTLKRTGENRRRQDWRIAVTNALPVAIDAEFVIPYELADRPAGVERGEGGWLLKTRVAANGSADLAYRVKLDR
ncbi:DUF4139 domain-containing protein [Sphingomonas flavalba]|uniref:DUF4139 domain-containing protein n=1 Tax=Sphingomonas flavalba TaxID=2559804 RepID=UPI00109E0146|nr:hypothetical protein [Sphingomonas flavalba]